MKEDQEKETERDSKYVYICLEMVLTVYLAAFCCCDSADSKEVLLPHGNFPDGHVCQQRSGTCCLLQDLKTIGCSPFTDRFFL